MNSASPSQSMHNSAPRLLISFQNLGNFPGNSPLGKAMVDPDPEDSEKSDSEGSEDSTAEQVTGEEPSYRMILVKSHHSLRTIHPEVILTLSNC